MSSDARKARKSEGVQSDCEVKGEVRRDVTKGAHCHDHSRSVPVVPLEDMSIPVRVHSTGLVHNRTRSTSPLRVSALRTGYACH